MKFLGSSSLPRPRRLGGAGLLAAALSLSALDGARAATFTVINTNNSGTGSLRQAILSNNAAGGGTNLIQFDVPGAGVQTIAPLTDLPPITVPVVIDGFTQPGASPNTLAQGNNAVLKIRLDGSAVADAGLTLSADGSSVRGIVVVNCRPRKFGILLQAGSGSTVEGCFVGLEEDGRTPAGNGWGIGVIGASASRVGGDTPGARNVISGNDHDGVEIISATGTRVAGNYIGTDASGLLGRGNGGVGVYGTRAGFSIIGGTNLLERNVISGNASPFFASDGVELVQCNSNSVLGNYIGVNADGTSALTNLGNGVTLVDGVRSFVGGGGPGAGNVISGNLSYGVLVYGADARDNVIRGNRIGTAPDGLSAVANGHDGVAILEGVRTIIGGANAGEGNQISGNGDSGVLIGCCNPTTGNRLLGNLIGTDATGAGALGNGREGVTISTSQTTVGGVNTGEANIIAFNPFAGVSVSSGNGNSIRGNSIHSNGGYGIDLYGSPGLTSNDPGDGDTGGNDLQNFPVLTAAVLTPTNVVVSGSLKSQANRTYRVDFYGNTVCGWLNYGQGKTWFGTAVVTTDSNGDAAFTAYFKAPVLGSFITATATDANNSTSEFSSCVPFNTNGLADLVVTRAVTPDPVIAGQPLAFTITVSNAGPHAATRVELRYSLDLSALKVVSAAVSQGIVGTDGPFYVFFGTLAVGETAALRLEAIPIGLGAVRDDGSILFSDQHDFVSGNNSVSGAITVVDGPGIFEFSEPGYTVREDGGAATIIVQRLGGALGTVSVDYATANLTGLAGIDYDAADGTLVFTNGERTKGFMVSVRDDAVPGCLKTVLLTLSRPAGGAVLVGNTNATLSIIDNDLTLAGTVEAASLDNHTPPRTGDSGSFQPVISANGAFVAFNSAAGTLVNNASNGSQNLFLRDLASHTTKLVSVNTNGSAPNNVSHLARISAEGRFVAFESDASDLVAGDTNGVWDVFLRDVATATTLLVSVNQDGTGSGNGPSYAQSITPDGRFIVFESFASNLATNDSNGTAEDIFLRDLSNGAMELISVDAAGTGSGNLDSYGPTISDDGRFVAFASAATDLNPAGTNGFAVYVRDRLAGSNILCSVATNRTGPGNGPSGTAVISANGRVVVFTSDASDLVPGDTNNAPDIFAYEIPSGQLQLVSATLAGTGSANDGSYSPVVSADGRFVAFYSFASDLVANDGNGKLTDVFVRDLIAGTTTLVSANCHGASGNDASDSPVISADGRFVAFASYASDLVPGEFTPYTANIFRRDLLTGATLLLSFNRDRTGDGDDFSLAPVMAADGRTVAFESYSSNLVENDDNGADDVFVWRAPEAGPSGTNAAIAALTLTSGGPVLAVNGSPGTLYLLQRTTSLLPPIIWTPRQATNAPANGYFEFTDETPPSGSTFYRVARPP